MPDRSTLTERLKKARYQLGEKLSFLDVYSIDIHSYSSDYLKKYLNNIDYELKLNCSIIESALKGRVEHLENLTILDFGGGIGMLSMLARLCGVGSVVYYDRDDQIRRDFHTLLQHLEISDIELFSSIDFDNYLDKLRDVEVVITRDVIEHVYDPESWFKEYSGLEGVNTIVHNTSANMYCFWLRAYFNKVHERADKEGYSDGSIKADTSGKAYALKRREFLAHLGVKDENNLDRYTVMTRGLDYQDMEEWLNSGAQLRALPGSNTCDPETGNWAERLIALEEYQKFAEFGGFTFEARGGILDVKGSMLSRMFRRMLNFLIRNGIVGPSLWPSLTLVYRR